MQFRWDGDVLVHRPTGVRLPKTHDGCTLAAIAPPRTGGYERGGSAEYDCRPATDLTYVSVTFEGGAPALGRENLQMAVARVAAGLTMQDASIPGSPCVVMDLKTEPGHVNRDLAAAQCGVRWRKRGSEAMFGTATYVLGRGLNYVALTNTCSGPACAPNRPKFGHFIDTFDETAMGGDIAPSS